MILLPTLRHSVIATVSHFSYKRVQLLVRTTTFLFPCYTINLLGRAFFINKVKMDCTLMQVDCLSNSPLIDKHGCEIKRTVVKSFFLTILRYVNLTSSFIEDICSVACLLQDINTPEKRGRRKARSKYKTVQKSLLFFLQVKEKQGFLGKERILARWLTRKNLLKFP